MAQWLDPAWQAYSAVSAGPGHSVHKAVQGQPHISGRHQGVGFIPHKGRQDLLQAHANSVVLLTEL